MPLASEPFLFPEKGTVPSQGQVAPNKGHQPKQVAQTLVRCEGRILGLLVEEHLCDTKEKKKCKKKLNPGDWTTM